MKERPIIFTAESVRAILEERKTQSRRVIKPQPTFEPEGGTFKPPRGRMMRTGIFRWRDEWWWQDPQPSMLAQCPYGQPGDRLWVRETWAAIWPGDYPVPERDCNIEYRADTPNAPYPGDWPADEARGNDEAPKWRPSMFMPRWASRLTLRVTDVRVERVQEISLDDVLAEGIERDMSDSQYWRENTGIRFAAAWDTINGKRPGCSWADNPFCWCIAFEVVP